MCFKVRSRNLRDIINTAEYQRVAIGRPPTDPLVIVAFAMAWTLGSRALQALAALAIVGLAGVGVTAYDNSRYDNVGSFVI